MFREDEHPRDKSGKFTDKGAGVGEGEKLRKAVRIYSDEPEKDAPPQKVPEPATGFNRLETKHHQRHVKEMGFKNTKEYEKAASSFSTVIKEDCITAKSGESFIGMMQQQAGFVQAAKVLFIR